MAYLTLVLLPFNVCLNKPLKTECIKWNKGMFIRPYKWMCIKPYTKDSAMRAVVLYTFGNFVVESWDKVKVKINKIFQEVWHLKSIGWCR